MDPTTEFVNTVRPVSSHKSPSQRLSRRCFAMLTVFLAACLLLHSGSAQAPTAPHWELSVPVLDADISPDDRFVAITTESPEFPQRGETVNESAAIWDYKQHKEIAKAAVADSLAGLRARSGPIRFTYDGAFLVAAAEGSIRVFDAATLKLLRTIEPPLSSGCCIREIETSPVSHVALVAADNNGLRGELLAYNLDDGRELLRRTDITRATSIAWRPDGAQFALAMPFPCSRRGDIEVFSFGSWAQIAQIHGPNLESVAFGSNKLYAVQTSFCKGTVFNRHLGMEVFDSKGKHKKNILLAGRDIHDSVSYSNGMVLADTGTVNAEFDALDMTTSAAAAAARMTIWKSDTGSIAFSSEPIDIHAGSHTPYAILRLSRTGKMVIVVDRYVRVFQLP